MTLDEARAHIGSLVVYHAPHLSPTSEASDEGAITSVGERYVFVRYGSQQGSRATDAAALTLVSP
jgi:hypothetical protein